ncbi:MAG TPA: GlsB/YeaQ/YmgE family stress response membrane protein [bacterium]|jgi:uncharacterized membrane protein YeaQ/YmgE (transglycosylase-associated protein family)
MNIAAWIIVGLLVSWLARKVVPGREGGGLVATLVLGILGAMLGGWIATWLGLASPYGVNFWSVFIAAVGAVVALVLWNAVMRRRPVT